ncbi:MAG TPA: hypothetical protein VN367_03705, partial [Chlorobaculum sp.]|nr:hypothetical protein [Chlorobaculum sp.]
MKTGIRQKLLLGLSGMLVIVTVISIMTIRQIDDLGKSLAVVLKQNYLSVVACQDMKDALERIDSGILNTFIGNHDDGVRMVNEHKAKFNDALNRELHNITVPGEQDRAERVRALSAEYFGILSMIMDRSQPEPVRRRLYYEKLVPMFEELRAVAQ